MAFWVARCLLLWSGFISIPCWLGTEFSHHSVLHCLCFVVPVVLPSIWGVSELRGLPCSLLFFLSSKVWLQVDAQGTVSTQPRVDESLRIYMFEVIPKCLYLSTLKCPNSAERRWQLSHNWKFMFRAWNASLVESHTCTSFYFSEIH